MTKRQFKALMKALGCCLLGICCPPGSPTQRAAFRKLAAKLGASVAEADAMFDAAVAQKAG
jgi:hypothetical protein